MGYILTSLYYISIPFRSKSITLLLMNEREVLFQGHEGPVLNYADLEKWISYKGYILGLYYYASISLMPRSVTCHE